MMTPTQRVVAEIPQVLQEALQDYLGQHPDWDQNRVFAAALSLFLLQNGDGDRRASKVYLESLFRPATVRKSDGSPEVLEAPPVEAQGEGVEPVSHPAIAEEVQEPEEMIAPEPTAAAPTPAA